MNKQAAKDKSAGGVSGSREQSGGGGGSSSSSDRKQSGSTQKTVISLKVHDLQWWRALSNVVLIN